MRSQDPRQRDAERMAAVAEGDERAFAALHDEHYRAAYRLAVAVVLDRDEARDVVQEAFIRLHRVSPRWEPRARVGTWLRRTTLNIALSTRRRVRRWLGVRAGATAPHRGPEEVASAEELHRQVRDELRRLSPRQRAVATLHLDAELTPAEIAQQLGISPNAARVTLHKGLSKLRVRYDDAFAPADPQPEEHR